MSEHKECVFTRTCDRVDPTDPFCYSLGGTLGNGKRAYCYRENSLWYDSWIHKTAKNVVRVSVYAAEGLIGLFSNRIIKGFVKAEDSEIE